MSDAATSEALQSKLNERRRRFTQEDKETVRAREDRPEGEQRARRRRRGSSLDRMAQFRLDCDPERLDTENWVYRWANDEPGRLVNLTKKDDYDFVTQAEVGEAFEDEQGGETDGRVRRVVGWNNKGDPLYAYLLKKPREYWVEDYEGVVEFNRRKLEDRVEQGAGALDDVQHGYLPKGNFKAARLGRAA